MANQPRDTVTYELKDGNTTLYIGRTNNPEERARQHRQKGKKFGRLHITSVPLTREIALKKEKQDLATYRNNHGGKNPPYNKDSDG